MQNKIILELNYKLQTTLFSFQHIILAHMHKSKYFGNRNGLAALYRWEQVCSVAGMHISSK